MCYTSNIPICNRFVDRNRNPANPAPILNHVPVLEPNRCLIDFQITMGAFGNEETHAGLVTEMSRHVSIHEVFETVPVFRREACRFGRAGMIAAMTGERNR